MEPENLRDENYTYFYRVLRYIAALAQHSKPGRPLLIDVWWLLKNKIPVDDIQMVINQLNRRRLLFIDDTPEWERFLGEKHAPPGTHFYEGRLKREFQDYFHEMQRREFAEILYRITRQDRKILVNGIAVSEPRANENPDNMMDYLLAHPRKRVTTKELHGLNIKPARFAASINSLGFRGILLDLFFEVTKTTVLLRNDITRKELVERGFRVTNIEREIRKASKT